MSSYHNDSFKFQAYLMRSIHFMNDWNLDLYVGLKVLHDPEARISSPMIQIKSKYEVK